MKFMKLSMVVLVAMLIAVMGTAAFTSEQYMGMYSRKGDAVKVYLKDGKLYCLLLKDNKEMCNGMEKITDTQYKGPNMKHPTMPGTFKGTVDFKQGELEITGCWGRICPSETWKKK